MIIQARILFGRGAVSALAKSSLRGTKQSKVCPVWIASASGSQGRPARTMGESELKIDAVKCTPGSLICRYMRLTSYLCLQNSIIKFTEI
jgi:hypothetical protein